MSIYHEVIRDFVISELEAVKERLDADDGSWMGVWRDPGLSEEKKRLAETLINKIREFKDLGADDKNKDHIQAEILTVKSQALDQCEKKGQGEGKFGRELSELHHLVERIYLKFERCRILNLPKDSDPYHAFCFQAGAYLAEKALDFIHRSSLESITHHPNVSNLWQLTNRKEDILRRHIIECKASLEVLDKRHLQYKEYYKRRVVECIEAVLRENEEVCKEYRAGISVPLVSFGMLSVFSASPSIGPRRGLLETHMHRAIREIDEVASEVAVAPASGGASAQMGGRK